MKSTVVFAAVSLSHVIGAPAESMAQQTTRGTTIVVQMSYYALPGKEQEVLNIRLSASDVLERNGVTRGRVLTRDEGPRQDEGCE